MLSFYLIIISSAIFLFIYLKKKSIARKLGLIDFPDKKLKKHKKNTPILGGVIFISIAIFILIVLIYSKDIISAKIVLLSLFCSIVGIIDDIYKIKPNSKFFFITGILLFFVILFPELRIKHLIFKDIPFLKNIYLENKIFLGILTTILCYQLLIHALNLADGHNGIAALMAITWVSYIYIAKTNSQFLVTQITALLLFIYFNLKSKIFLGDSGNYFLSSFVGSLIIMNNNLYKNFYIEEIFILLMLPGIDMLRLFFIRIKNKKNPFFGDTEHLHHLLFMKFNQNITILVYYIIFIIPIILLSLKIFLQIQIIIIFIIIYFIILSFIRK